MENCEAHAGAKAIGYCHGCGRFGCADCLPASDAGGLLYCQACSERLGIPARREPVRPEQVHHRYIVRFKDGRRLRGTYYKINLETEGFNFIALNARGETSETVFVKFSDVKGVFQVRDFAGNRRHPARYLTSNPSDPNEAAVYFADGEVVRGRITGNRTPRDGRFYLVPRDPDDNNVLIIVEGSAVDRVEVHGVRRSREFHDLIDNAVRKRLLVYYWRHRGRTVTMAEVAQRIERTPAAIEQNLDPFVQHGLLEHRTAEGQDLLAFKDTQEPELREFLKAQFEEVSRYYFHAAPRPQPGART